MEYYGRQQHLMYQLFHDNRSLLHQTPNDSRDEEVHFRSGLTTWEDSIVASYLLTVCVLAAILNILVICTCLRHWNALVMSDFYILNLACSDVILPLCGFPLTIISAFNHRWMFGDLGCTLYGAISFFFGLVSITTLTIMSVTRYISICHPHIGVSGCELTRKLLVFPYMNAIVWTVIPLSGWGSYTVESYGTSCTLQWDENRSFITLMSVCCIIGPSAVIATMYGLILIEYRRSNRNMSTWRSSRSRGISKKESFLIKITFAMCLGFLLSWMPYAVVSMWTAYGDAKILPIRINVVAVLLAKTSTVVNPVIYFLFSNKFRPMLKQWLDIKSNTAKLFTTCSRARGHVSELVSSSDAKKHSISSGLRDVVGPNLMIVRTATNGGVSNFSVSL